MDRHALGEPSSSTRKRRARLHTVTKPILFHLNEINKAKSIQSSSKKKIEVRIGKVPPSEDKAKSEIRQVLLTNDKAKDMEGQSNLFDVQKTWRNYTPTTME